MRRSGRTTRMIEDVAKTIAENKNCLCSVIIRPGEEDYIISLLKEHIGNFIKEQIGLSRFELIGNRHIELMHSSHQDINWRLLIIHGRSGNHFTFFDHGAIEHNFSKILDLMHKYDMKIDIMFSEWCKRNNIDFSQDIRCGKRMAIDECFSKNECPFSDEELGQD